MTRSRLMVGGVVAALAATTFLFGGIFRDSTSAQSAAPAAAAAGPLQTGFSSGNTPRLVLQLEETLRLNPDDARSYVLLGLAYQQRARETGDPTFYSRSGRALDRALALNPSDADAVSGLAALALARHRFREALSLARRARDLSPRSARTYGAIGDALVELGRYPEAFRAFDTMADLKPGLAAYARISYARELLGRRQAAIDAMQLAVEAATGGPEAAAWTHVQLGKLYWDAGEYRKAALEHRTALSLFPGYHYALDALARVEAARGRYVRAIALARQAVEAVPLPHYVAFLGDLYRATRRERLARRQYALIGAIDRLLEANGVQVDLESAVYRADQRIRPEETVALARQARAARPSIYGDDALGWALARAGRCEEALPWATRALRLGTKDPLLHFHRGYAAGCAGDRREMRDEYRRALELNSEFSVRWAPVARAAISAT